MSYAQIDQILIPWAERNNIKIFTMDRDWEIRSFSIHNNLKYLIKFPEGNNITIEVFDFKTRNNLKKEIVDIDKLKEYLSALIK